jgi:hypothetical protein
MGLAGTVQLSDWSALTPALSPRRGRPLRSHFEHSPFSGQKRTALHDSLSPGREFPGLCARFAPRNLPGIGPFLPLFPTQEGGEGRGEEELFLWMAPLSDSLPVRSSRGERERGPSNRWLLGRVREGSARSNRTLSPHPCANRRGAQFNSNTDGCSRSLSLGERAGVRASVLQPSIRIKEKRCTRALIHPQQCFASVRPGR